MKHSSNRLKYISAAILAVLMACILHPASSNGQPRSQAQPQVQRQPRAHAQKPWKDLPPEQFNRIRATSPGAVLIDTRMEAKYERERIPGALPAPYSEELEALTDTLSPQTPLLIYCGDDERSTTVCRMLTEEMGFVNVFRLKGGLRRWKKENLPLDTLPKAGS